MEKRDGTGKRACRQTRQSVDPFSLCTTKLTLAKAVFMHTLGVAFGSTLITVLRAEPKAGDDVLNCEEEKKKN